MAEKIVSPGVFTNEIDASFLPAAIGDIGAAIIGPTVKGPHLTPTVVESYAEYQAKFGDSFKSGSQYYTYFTSIAAKNYLQHAGRLTVVRVAGDGITNASASVSTTEDATTGDTAVGLSAVLGLAADGDAYYVTSSLGSYQFIAVDLPLPDDNESEKLYYYHGVGGTLAHQISSASVKLNAILPETFLAEATKLQMTASTGGTAGNSLGFNSSSVALTLAGGTAGTTNTAFELHTLADGTIMNNSGSIGTNETLGSATKDSVRWEISNSNYKKGTFTLVVRAGKDTIKRKNPLETWNDLSLDPTSNNYIEARIGNQYNTIATDGSTTYLQPTGDFVNKSKYIRIASVTQTPDYLDENGAVTYTNSGSLLPAVGSGSLAGAFQGGLDGVKTSGQHKFYGDACSAADGWQGLNLTANSETGSEQFVKALNLLANDDEYDINMILMPGVTNDIASHLVSKAIDTAEARGDTFYVADPIKKGGTVATATAAAETYDSNYTSMYWPWVQVNEPQIGRNVWVPPSAMMAGVIAFNDKVSHEWFAPAGLNRGGLDMAIQAERKLTHANRDTLYESSVNPLATFPGEGVVCWGQKTLQKKSSALDRVNVRRLLIRVKKFIAASSRFLVFEQNNASTRTRFLNIANPFLEQVQQNSGLSAFKVIMDDTNNTPDLVDRNVLYGQIFLQPTRTAEFIVLDFTVMPTGATFPE